MSGTVIQARVAAFAVALPAAPIDDSWSDFALRAASTITALRTVDRGFADLVELLIFAPYQRLPRGPA